MTPAPPGQWRSVLIECEPGFDDLVSGFVFEAGFAGLEEREVPGRTLFTAFFPPDTSPDPIRLLARMLVPVSTEPPPGRILSSSAVPVEDWEWKWREGLGAVETGRLIVVRPSWIEYRNTGGRIEIVIDPKMAFGTGGHATTVLCLEALERLDPAGKTVIDCGCGSGVLSIAAARLGAARVYGFDNDPPSVENARENILLNGVADRVTVETAELSDARPEPADILLANLISGVIATHIDRLRSFLVPGGTAVFSGMLAEEEKPMRELFERGGLGVRGVARREEWIAVTAERRT